MLKNYLIVFLLSMVPLLELRFAVPIAVGMELPPLLSIAVCALGNMIPVPFIYFFARKILLWGMDKPVIGKSFRFLHDKGERAGQKLRRKAGRRGLFLALLLFVRKSSVEQKAFDYAKTLIEVCERIRPEA